MHRKKFLRNAIPNVAAPEQAKDNSMQIVFVDMAGASTRCLGINAKLGW